MPEYLPDSAYHGAGRRLHKDVQMQVYTHRLATDSIVVPAVLSSTSLCIIEVALEVGYNSPGHFAQVFKRHTGMTPRAYRQQ